MSGRINKDREDGYTGWKRREDHVDLSFMAM